MLLVAVAAHEGDTWRRRSAVWLFVLLKEYCVKRNASNVAMYRYAEYCGHEQNLLSGLAAFYGELLEDAKSMHKWRGRNDAEQLSYTVLSDMRSHFQAFFWHFFEITGSFLKRDIALWF